MYLRSLYYLVIVSLVVAANAGSFDGKRKLQEEVTSKNEDRLVQSMNAAHDALEQAVSGGSSARVATAKNLAYSKLASKLSADPWEFGGKRKLHEQVANKNEDRLVQSMNAAHDAIQQAVSGGSSARMATDKNLAYSRLATKLSADPWEFGRKMLSSGYEANNMSDRLAQSMNAAHDAILSAVTTRQGARGATTKNLAYSKLTTKPATDAWEFDKP